MYQLRMLGGIGLTDGDGRELEALLRQTKHIALLGYLAMPAPGAWHRRETILGMFWPEHDQSRARSSLRSALYLLRGHLADGSIRTRGDDEISLNPATVFCDVAAMSENFEAGRFSEALGNYRGEFLPGVHVTDAAAFEKWLDQERRRLRNIARKAATNLSDAAEKSGNIVAAIEAASRAAELDPDDEAAARRWIALLDRAGDRAGAFAVYERFRNHMSDAFGVRPSAETVALLDAVRTRIDASPIDSARPASVPLILQTPDERPTPIAAKRPARWLAPAIIAVAGAAIVALAFREPELRAAKPSAALTGRTLVVLPMNNETGDSSLAYVASGVADGIARRLEGIGGITVRSGARSDWTDSRRQDLGAIGRGFGSTILLRTNIRKVGDSLEVDASVMDASTSEERRVAARRFITSGIRDTESLLAADIAGAMFRVPIPTDPRRPDRAVDPESYRLTLEGWHQIFLRRPGRNIEARRIAEKLFTQAIDIDPANARAWSGLSSVWASLVVIDGVAYDEGRARATAAAMRALALDSLQGTALANLAIIRAFEDSSIAVALPLLAKAEAAEPSNPEVFLIKSLVFRSAHLYDQARDAARMARRLDPLSPFFANEEANGEMCAGQPEIALKLYRAELATNPGFIAQDGATNALALLGRYDEAIASWRESAAMTRDTATLRLLSASAGKEGYWSARHEEGRRRLATLDARRARPLAVALAHFAAGDADRGFAGLERARLAGTPALYRLTCMTRIAEFLGTPRFADAVARIGALRHN